MSSIAVRVENLSKKYNIGNNTSGSLREATTGIFSKNGQNKTSEFWALKNISFEIKRGEALGIIGKNGAGKSTLLKVLSRITEPTAGRVEIDGRVSSLLEVGTGFHPELTGRENVFLNGTILGMKRAEVREKFDEIVTFSGVEKFLDTPVKRYSSGMKVRLAFAVAAHLEPEILIIDEVLAVGDAEFQKKCLGKMEDVTSQGRTVVFVSHDMGAVSRLTSRSVFLNKGMIELIGDTNQVVEHYLTFGYEEFKQKKNLDYFRKNKPSEALKIKHIDVSSSHPGSVEMGEAFAIEIAVEAYQEISGANLTIILKKSDGIRVAVLFSWDNDFKLFLEPGVHLISVVLENHHFAVGGYLVDVGINQSINSAAFDVIKDFPLFKVKPSSKVLEWEGRPWGAIHLENLKWKVENATIQSR